MESIHYGYNNFTVVQERDSSEKGEDSLDSEVSNLFNYFGRTGIDVSRDLRAMKGIN